MNIALSSRGAILMGARLRLAQARAVGFDRAREVLETFPDPPDWDRVDFSPVLCEAVSIRRPERRFGRDIGRIKRLIERLLSAGLRFDGSNINRSRFRWEFEGQGDDLGVIDSARVEANRRLFVRDSYFALACMTARMTRAFNEFEVAPGAIRADCRVGIAEWEADALPATFHATPMYSGCSSALADGGGATL